MQKGQTIRVRATPVAARDWGVSVGALGVVLCHYNLVARGRDFGECVDVRFGPKIIVWGAPASAFEEVAEPVQ
ncbi:MAG: hypothetical protein ACLPN5_07820 [Roseiarcus sp.]